MIPQDAGGLAVPLFPLNIEGRLDALVIAPVQPFIFECCLWFREGPR